MEAIIGYCHEKLNTQWDTFVHEVNGELLQTTAWANYELKYHNRRAVRLYVKNEEDAIVAGCQITIINDVLFGNIGLVRSGPCFRTKTQELMNLIVKEMRKSISILNLSYLIVTPDYNEYDVTPFLESEKFESKIPNLPPHRCVTTYSTSLLLDLRLSADDLLQQMTPMRRRGIKKGMKSPLIVKFGGRNDLKIFFDLYNFTATRHQYIDPVTHKSVTWYPTIESYDELCKIWDELSPNGWIKLFLGEVENEIICGSLVFTFGNTFRYSKWGWNLKYPEYHVSEAIQWEMIRWAQVNGFQYYDFCEIDVSIAETYLSSGQITDDIKSNFFYGPTVYKINFGGNIVKYPGTFVCYSDKMKHLIETSGDELTRLLKLSKDYYWATKNFFRDHINFINHS